jgi:hypothetical protein
MVLLYGRAGQKLNSRKRRFPARAVRHADRLMTTAVDKRGGTLLYDRMQYWMNGIER